MTVSGGQGRPQANSVSRAVLGHAVAAPPRIHVPARESTPYDKKVDVIKSMDSWMSDNIEPFLIPSSKSWQPSDFLPSPTSPDFEDAIRALRDECRHLPAEYLVVLVGDMVTEEALPSYMSMLNRMDGSRDNTGGDNTAWGRWNRGWTSEENRHGDLLNKFLYLSGAVDMRAVEQSVQALIGTGFDPMMATDPYLCFVYTSFQERATKISHGNTAVLAEQHGAPHLSKICRTIAGDEARHEAAYQKIVDELMRRDPDAAVLAFADMMHASIVMPAHLMQDGGPGIDARLDAEEAAYGVAAARRAAGEAPAGQPHESAFFKGFAAVADGLGVYTAADYAACVDHLLRRWKIADMQIGSGEAAQAQEYLMKHRTRMQRIANVLEERKQRQRARGRRSPSFSCRWVFGKEISI
eukprot:jgi/Ulvmu1/2378/UM130_0011.1